MISKNVSFKGYKNVMCAFDVPISQTKSASCMSIQLNDDDGFKDLTEYKNIKSLQGDVISQNYSDVITLTYIQDERNRKDNIYFDTKDMYWGDELKFLGENYVPKMMSQEQYKKEEALHMKVYTFLASLTKRMAYMPVDFEDGDRIRVIQRMYSVFYPILQNQNSAFNLIEEACRKKIKIEDIALGFNNGIARTMAKFFK